MQKKLEFTYQLTYEESYETFLVLSMRQSRRVRNILAAVLTVIAVVMLVLYYLNSNGFHYFVIAVLDILLLAYLIYVPALKAKKGAKAVSRQKGTYKMELTEGGNIRSQGGTIPLAGDKDARAVETEKVFALRPDRVHTFCLPKRILTPEETDRVREILRAKTKYVKM